MTYLWIEVQLNILYKKKVFETLVAAAPSSSREGSLEKLGKSGADGAIVLHRTTDPFQLQHDKVVAIECERGEQTNLEHQQDLVGRGPAAAKFGSVKMK